MVKILFVCHGNICRSPMAEFVMKDLVRREKCADRFEIASAAVSREEIGNPVYPPARRKLAEHGISCAGKTARQMTKADYVRYDYIIGMDEENRRDLLRIYHGDPEGKVSLRMAWAGEPREVSDPWYTRDFDQALEDIELGCRALAARLAKK